MNCLMKKLVRQILLLAAGLFLICFLWRLSLHNTYTLHISVNDPAMRNVEAERTASVPAWTASEDPGISDQGALEQEAPGQGNGETGSQVTVALEQAAPGQGNSGSEPQDHLASDQAAYGQGQPGPEPQEHPVSEPGPGEAVVPDLEARFQTAEEDILVFGEAHLHGDYYDVEVKPTHSGSVHYRIDPETQEGSPGSSPQGTLHHEQMAEFSEEWHFQVGQFGTVYDRRTGGFTGDTIVLFSVAAFFLAVSFLMMRYFITLKENGLYSYYAIYTSGFSLFSGVTGVVMLYAFIRHLVNPFQYNMMKAYETLLNVPVDFMTITAPVILAFSVLMAVSNIELLRHERFRTQNVLGILAALILIVGEAVGLLIRAGRTGVFSEDHRLFITANTVYCTAYVYFECMLAGAVICGLRSALHKPSMDRDFIIILGCRFRRDGTLTPLLQGRCDRAVSFWRKQNKTAGKEAILIPSGGQGPDECMSEAEAMANYLLSVGIPERVIRREDQARNTFQNMAFSKEIIEREMNGRELLQKEDEKRQTGAEKIDEDEKRSGTPGIEQREARVVFSTTNYHVFRSGVWAGLAGLKAEGIGSRTKWWFWPNAFLRECVGLLVNRVRQEILLLVCWNLFYWILVMALEG